MSSATEDVTVNDSSQVSIASPNISDGKELWKLAKATPELDLNSSYMYLVIARDFSRMSRIARNSKHEVVGYVLGYWREEEPGCLFIWQIAVAEELRGAGLAKQLLDDIIRQSFLNGQPVETVEATVTEDNLASHRLFSSLATRWGAELSINPLFNAIDFPDEHETELLYRIRAIKETI